MLTGPSLRRSNKLAVLTVISSFLVFIALSTSAAAVVNFFEGNVSIGTNGSANGNSTNGAKVGVYVGSSLLTGEVATVGKGGITDSNYILDFQCTVGDALFLKVWGINASATTCVDSPVSNVTNLSVSLVASGGSCSYSSACTGSNVCCSGSTEVNDGTTSGATCKSSCSTGSTTTTGGGGGSSSTSGGGGGGGGAALTSESSTPVSVSGAKSTKLSYAKTSDIAVQEITLKTSSTAAVTNGKVTVSETTVGSSISGGIAKGSTKVYKYLSITKSNIKDADLEEATVKFEVPASWINANRIDPATVKLNRFVSNEWVSLSTKLVSSSSSKYVFEAVTPDFSIFAVSGEQLPEKLTAFQLIDIIRDFYAGKSAYSAFDIIDLIRDFYA